MIKTIENDSQIDSNNIQQLLYKDALVERLAVQIIASHVECFVDMAADLGPEEFPSYDKAAEYLKAAQSSVEDMVGDLLTEFRDTLYEKIRACKVNVKSVSLSELGLVDADVEVSC